MSLDRARLHKAIALYRDQAFVILEVSPDLVALVEAAELIADPDTLVISKVDGEWPTSAIAAFEYAFEGDESDFGIVELCTQILDALLEGPK